MSEYTAIVELEKQYKLNRKNPNAVVGCAVEFCNLLLAAHLKYGNGQETWYKINGSFYPVGKHWRTGWDAEYHTDFLKGKYTPDDTDKVVALESLFPKQVTVHEPTNIESVDGNIERTEPEAYTPTEWYQERLETLSTSIGNHLNNLQEEEDVPDAD